MIDFATIWNNQISKNAKVSVLAGITDHAINNYLKAHRKFDGQRYLVHKEFSSGNKKNLIFTLIVGGNKSDQKKGKANPLAIRLPKNNKDAKPAKEYSVLYDYPPEHGTVTYDQLAAELPNIIISGKNINLYMEWPNSQGGSWKHHLAGIDFDLEAKIDLLEDDKRFSLSFVPIRLSISQQSKKLIQKSVAEIAKKKGNGMPYLKVKAEKNKISDLFMAIINLAASTIGPDLVKNIQIPVFELGKFQAYPSALAIGNGAISIGAQLDSNGAKRELEETLVSLRGGYLSAFERDLENSGGTEALLWDKKYLRQAARLPASEREQFLIKKPTKTIEQIKKHLSHSQGYAAEQIALLTRLPSTKPQNQVTTVGVAKQAIAIAINEATFDELVADVGGKSKSGRTGLKSAVLIRGSLGYDLKIGIPDISIGNNGLTGSISVDVFAGLYYQVKEILNCSWRWSREHRIGLGVKGSPKLTIKTKKNKQGLSLSAKVDLGGLKLQTGLGKLVDVILKALFWPFMKLIELALNAFLKLLSYVIVPIQFQIPNQNTSLRLSEFTTKQYLRNKVSSKPTHNFLLVVSSAKGIKG